MTQTNEQEFDRHAYELACEITSAFPNLKMKPEEIYQDTKRSLAEMEAAGDPVNGFDFEQRDVYERVVIREMMSLLDKLKHVTKAETQDSALVHMIDLSVFMMESRWRNSDIKTRLQCERIEAFAKELDVARSKSHLTNAELFEAAGVEDSQAERRAICKRALQQELPDEERAAVIEKAIALYDQDNQKIAAFLFNPAPSRPNGHD